MVFDNRDLLGLILAPLDCWGLRAAEGVGKGWRDAAHEAPRWLEFDVHTERRLRAVCAIGGLHAVLDPETDITLSGDRWAGPLELANGTTLRGGTVSGQLLRRLSALTNSIESFRTWRRASPHAAPCSAPR